MTANSTTIITTRRRSTLAHLARVGGSMTAVLSAIRARWDGWAHSGQLGPVREAEIGRHTGARI